MILGIDTIEINGCSRCKCSFSLPMELYKSAQASENISFFCPYGHEQHFPKGETQEQKLRRERDRLAQRIAEKDDEIARQRRLREGAEKKLSATRGVVTRFKNRVSNGVCPCCTRSFTNLRGHMATQHPEWKAEAAE